MTTRCRAAARGVTYFELLAVLALLALLLGAMIIPSYRAFSAARAAHEAAVTLAEDIVLLERTAQNGSFGEGSSLLIASADPLSYACYVGRPFEVDPQSKLGQSIVQRTFVGVRLAGGPINVSTPLLFAGNGSAQYVTGGTIASQHQVVVFELASTADTARTAQVELNLYTGAIRIP